MRKTKTQKGITLIALIITIVVLLILAVVAIGAVQNDGIINHAKNARGEYGKAQDNENTTLEGYLDKLDKIQANLPGNNGGGNNQGGADTTPATTIAEAQADAMLTKTVNSDVTDKYSNKITVPAGFKILVDDTTGYTAETIDVTKGIVITDGTNEFVWVPVGTIYTNEEKTESKTITLGRYDFDSTTGEAITYTESDYTEDTKENHEDLGNVIAKDIEGFINSATTKCGYYLGRYEVGKENDTAVCKANQTVYGNVTQSEASTLSQNMYKDATTYTSDLVNSYAWDTAIVFIQTFSTEEDASNYANLNKSDTFTNTGLTGDKYCNIYDMSGNAFEWSTETYYDGANIPCVFRGGLSTKSGTTMGHTSYRLSTGVDGRTDSFRPILYVAL